MIAALDDDQRIAGKILGCDEPRCVAATPQTADAETAALTWRVALKTPVTPDHDTVLGLDRARPGRQPRSDECAKRPFADKADPGRVALVGNRQAAFPGNRPDLGFTQLTHRKIAPRELAGVERMQEVTLVLGRIQSAQQTIAGSDARVVTGGKSVGAETPCIGQANAELHLAIAQHIGVRRPAGLQLGQEMREHARAILGGKTDLVQRYVELRADPPRILKIRGTGAITVFVFLPVRHEQGFDVLARIEQQQCSHRRIHAAGQGNDGAR